MSSDFCQRPVKTPPGLVRKFCEEAFLEMYLFVGGIWKGDILVADIEELHASETQYEGGPHAENGATFIFLVAGGTVKLSGSDQVFRRTRRRTQR